MNLTCEAIGVDEAGRGCLAGPVFAAAVLWDPDVVPHAVEEDRVTFLESDYDINNNNSTNSRLVVIRDSKKLSVQQREAARRFIERNAASYSVASCDAATVDRLGILRATMVAMGTAIDNVRLKKNNEQNNNNNNKINKRCKESVNHVLIDGNYFDPKMTPSPGLTWECVVKGDGKVMAIAAASILAKTHRDEYIVGSPHSATYGWETNKGYGTRAHIEKLAAHGPCPEHRRSFVVGGPKKRVKEIENKGSL
jgi:ribonuclease HII